MGKPPGVGGTRFLPHIRRLGLFFGVQNSELQYFLGFSEKFLCNFGSFLRSRYRIGISFWVAKISYIFWGCLKFLIFFGGER